MKLTNIYEDIIKESSTTTIVAYHGTDHDIKKFSDSFLTGDKNIQHHGAGIYFATNYENARMFGKNLYKVELSGNFISDDNPSSNVNPEDLIKLMKLSDEDEWDLEAQNYHPDPEIGLQIAVDDALAQDNEADVFMRLQTGGWYMHDGLGYVRAMTKVGIDGVIVTPPSQWVGEKHIIMFNPNAIKFIGKEVVQEELTYRHASTDGVEDDEYEIGMVKESDTPNITVYHGRRSKYNSPEELFNKINTEDGALLYGWGLYVSDNQDVAIEYSKNNYSNDSNKFIGLAIELVNSTNVDDIIEFFKEQYEWDTLPKDVRNLLIQNRNVNANDLIQSGFLYEMEINVNKKPYKWNKEEYSNLTKKLGSQKAASQYLSDKGYFGVVSENSGLAGKYKKGKNYAIFSPNDVRFKNIKKL